MDRKLLLLASVFLFTATSCGLAPDITPIPVAPTLTPVPPAPALSVAYIDLSGNVWLWKDDGSDNILVNTQNVQDVQISSDGEVIAYLTADGQLHAVNADGTKDHILVDTNYLASLVPFGGSTATIYEFNFIPECHEIFFSVFVAGTVSGVDLFKVNADLGLRERVFAPGQGGNGNYFSPDGEWVVIAYPNQIILARINGTVSKTVFNLPPLRGFSAHLGPDIVWKGDSSGFYIVVPSYDGKDNYLGQQTLYLVPVDGDPIARQTFLALPFGEIIISPDGNRVASLMDDGDLTNLHIITVGDKDITYISDNNIGFFGWNPDSNHFVIWQKGEKDKPWLSTIDSMPQLLTGDVNQTVDSFEWVSENCFLFMRGNTLGLSYLIEPNSTTRSNVFVAVDVQHERYDFMGACLQ